MSQRFQISLAGSTEDAALKSVLGRTSMPGNISLAFNREPSFFAAENIGCLESQVVVCKDRENDQVIGFGSRSIRRLYVDGVARNIGYLSSLRLRPEFQRGLLLARGFKFFRELHQDRRVPYYITTVMADNTSAKKVLEGGRAGMPVYRSIGKLVTYLVPLRKKRRGKSPTQVTRVLPSDLKSTQHCLAGWNRGHEFAPVYTAADLSGQTGLLTGFSLDNLYTYKVGGEVVGTLGMWDQTPFKQTVVTGYSTRMKVIRPFYNGLMNTVGWPALPPVGQEIRYAYASLVSTKDNNQKILDSLLIKACQDWSGRGYDYLAIGCDATHDLSETLSWFAVRRLVSTVYLVSWPGDSIVLPAQASPIHLEVATL